jgi:hypothetical protein
LFASKFEELRKKSHHIDFELSVGNELSIESSGFIEGEFYGERKDKLQKNMWTRSLEKRFHAFLQELLDITRENFHGDISYSAGAWENVPWDTLDFDVIGETLYFSKEPLSDYVNKISTLQGYGKPVHVKEFGTSTYEGANIFIGRRTLRIPPWAYRMYDENAQAEYVKTYLDIFNETSIDGCFLYEFEAREPRNLLEFGIVDMPLKRRKKAFYMYKSYSISSP